MPICQNISVSTSRANFTEQPQQPCKATRETLASNPGNIGRQHYRQPCKLRPPSPPLSTLWHYRRLSISLSPRRIPANPSPLSCPIMPHSLTRSSCPSSCIHSLATHAHALYTTSYAGRRTARGMSMEQGISYVAQGRRR